jgi:hypothetical protein
MVSNNRIWADVESLHDSLPIKTEDASLCQTDKPILFEDELDPRNSDRSVQPGSKSNGSHCLQSLEFSSEKNTIGIEIFQRSALLSGSMLDEAVANVFKAVNLSSSSSVLFTRYSDQAGNCFYDYSYPYNLNLVFTGHSVFLFLFPRFDDQGVVDMLRSTAKKCVSFLA